MMKPSLRIWTRLVTLLFVIVPLSIGGCLLYFFLTNELENRRLITFLNFEQMAYRFDSSLQALTTFQTYDGNLTFLESPSALLGRTDGKPMPLSGSLPEGINATKLSDAVCDLQSVGNRIYALCPMMLPPSVWQGQAVSGWVWGVWALSDDLFISLKKALPHRISLVSQRGQLLFQSDSAVPQLELLKKPLIQNYIRSPLSKLGSAPYTEAGMQMLGFAMSLPKSNVAMFVESPASLVFGTLWKPTSLVLCVLFFGLGFLLFVWRMVLGELKDQLTTLARSFMDFTKGYNVPTQLNPEAFLSELKPIVDALNSGTVDLRSKMDKSPEKAEAIP